MDFIDVNHHDNYTGIPVAAYLIQVTVYLTSVI